MRRTHFKKIIITFLLAWGFSYSSRPAYYTISNISTNNIKLPLDYFLGKTFPDERDKARYLTNFPYREIYHIYRSHSPITGKKDTFDQFVDKVYFSGVQKETVHLRYFWTGAKKYINKGDLLVPTGLVYSNRLPPEDTSSKTGRIMLYLSGCLAVGLNDSMHFIQDADIDTTFHFLPIKSTLGLRLGGLGSHLGMNVQIDYGYAMQFKNIFSSVFFGLILFRNKKNYIDGFVELGMSLFKPFAANSPLFVQLEAKLRAGPFIGGYTGLRLGFSFALK